MIAIPLHTRRVQRGQFLQKLQHAIPSVVVLGDGISHLQHDPHGIDLALGVAEVGGSVLVIRKRELRVTDEGISVPGRFFTRLTLPWAELAEITIGPDKARVIATDGRDKQIELADAFGADAIRAALLEAQARHGAYRATLPGASS